MVFTLIVLAIVSLCNGQTRIVNGIDLKPGETIYQVAIQPQKQSWKSSGFGGTILNEYFVISSAWNLKNDVDGYSIIVPSEPNSTVPSTIHRVERIITHENYTGARLGQHDIALLKVKSPFDLSQLVNRVELPQSSDVLYINDETMVSGWAREWVTGPLTRTKTLKKTPSRISDLEDCFTKYSILGYSLNRDVQFCTLGEPNGPCNHDSGDPLIKDGKLIGISASGYSCDHSNFPSVYTNVVPYLDWIKFHTM